MLSDITINYGPHGERKFFRHKVILASKTPWFDEEFTGCFLEADKEEVTLHGDDPGAVEAMFEFAYDKEVQAPIEDTSSANVKFYIGVFEVADKYVYPELEKEASRLFSCWLDVVIDSMAEEDHVKALKDLTYIVAAIYHLAEVSNSTREVIAKTLMDVIFGNYRSCPLGAPAQLGPVIEDTCKKIPELGRDLYLGISRRRQDDHGPPRKAHLGVFHEVKCSLPYSVVLDTGEWRSGLLLALRLACCWLGKGSYTRDY